ncbi:MAG TPA: serine hydrolase domain-containing protein, partial [Ferruginibacter sp.]|nr:serine hydrolase domain-containing protein [Ferruginibacter sp.]
DFSRKYIFEPLNMNHTGWNVEELNPALVSNIYAHNDEQHPTAVVEHPQYYMTNYPVSGLKTNADDLSAYLMEMIRGYEGKGKLLSDRSYQTLFKPQLNCEGLNKGDTSPLNDKYNIATLWSVSPTGNLIHLGGNTGIYAFMYFNPRTKKGALAFCNLRDNSFGELFYIVQQFEEKMPR